MAVLTKVSYLAISNYYASIRNLLNSVSPYLYNAADVVVLSNLFEPTIDLMSPFYNAYISQSNVADTNAPFLSAVRAINNHIIQRGNYANIDAFLATSEAPGPSYVDPNWADMCSDAGFTITRVTT